MSEKAIVHKVPENVRRQSIETLKVRKESLEYLRKNGYKTIDDIIEGISMLILCLAWRDKANV